MFIFMQNFVNPTLGKSFNSLRKTETALISLKCLCRGVGITSVI